MRSDEEVKRSQNDAADLRSSSSAGAARRTMKWTTCATLLLFAVAMMLPMVPAPSAAQVPETPLLNLEDKIALGEVKGRIDHMALDPLRSRLFVAELENNSLGVVDLTARKVIHVIAGLTEPQGVGYEPSTDTLYVANSGDGSVRLYRGADYAETSRIDLGDDADNIRVDPTTKRVLIGYGRGGIATIDPATRAKIADFRLPAHPEGFQLDHKNNQVLVNLPRARAIAVLDGVSGQRKALWPMKESGANFPMAVDEDAQRVLVAFRAPGRLAVFSARTGESVASVELCGDADDLFVDGKRSRIYVSCGEGFIDVFDARADDYRRLARVPTVRGARTSYYVPSMDRLFLAVRAASLEPAAVWVYRPAP
jgi:DNA-binding beta-propeller fold protein YncE